MKQKLLRMRHAWYLLAACLTLLIPLGGEMQAAPSPQQTSVRVENVTSLKGLIQEIESQMAALTPEQKAVYKETMKQRMLAMA